MDIGKSLTDYFKKLRGKKGNNKSSTLHDTNRPTDG